MGHQNEEYTKLVKNAEEIATKLLGHRDETDAAWCHIRDAYIIGYTDGKLHVVSMHLASLTNKDATRQVNLLSKDFIRSLNVVKESLVIFKK